MGIFPKFRGENKNKKLKPPPRQLPNLEFMVSDQNDGTKIVTEMVSMRRVEGFSSADGGKLAFE